MGDVGQRRLGTDAGTASRRQQRPLDASPKCSLHPPAPHLSSASLQAVSPVHLAACSPPHARPQGWPKVSLGPGVFSPWKQPIASPLVSRLYVWFLFLYFCNPRLDPSSGPPLRIRWSTRWLPWLQHACALISCSFFCSRRRGSGYICNETRRRRLLLSPPHHPLGRYI